MQKLSVVVLLLALCLTQTLGYDTLGRELLQRGGGSSARGRTSSTSTGGSSSASARVTSTGGRSSASASASGKVFATTKNILIRYCEQLYNQYYQVDRIPRFRGGSRGRYCLSTYSIIDDLVVAYGKASASAFASTSATVDVQGSGSGCASAYADANSVAESYARIVGEAIAEARIGRFKAKADASFDIVSSVLVQAFARSHSDACLSEEGYASAYQKTHARAIGYPIATLWIWLFAEVDCRSESEFAEVVAEGEATIQTETSVTSDEKADASPGGRASAGGGGIATATQHCRNFDLLKDCCDRRELRRRRCYCGGSRRRPICNAVLERDVRRVWYDEISNTSCHC